MIFYHGTTEENWNKIQNEGVLYGIREAPSRVTYLTDTIEEAKQYGDVILEVEYDPYLHKELNNYVPEYWQVRVYEPIKLKNVKRL